MNLDQLLDAMGGIDSRYVEEALRYERPANKRTWPRWAALAACLCLAVGLAAGRGLHLPGGGAPGGAWPEGVDPVIASIAVLPAGERLTDVADATLDFITPEETAAHPLSAYLPDPVPHGYGIKNTGLYRTTMQDGTVHTLLRVTYQAAGAEHGEFVIFVMDYLPDTDRKIYGPDQITDSGQLDRTVHLRYGEVYVGVSKGSAEAEDVLAALRTIQPDT